MPKSKTYLSAHRVGYVDLNAMEELHGKPFRDFIEGCADAVCSGVVGGERRISAEDLTQNIEEEIEANADDNTVAALAKDFTKQLTRLKATGDLIVY